MCDSFWFTFYQILQVVAAIQIFTLVARWLFLYEQLDKETWGHRCAVQQYLSQWIKVLIFSLYLYTQ